jgi:hypothetical protein
VDIHDLNTEDPDLDDLAEHLSKSLGENIGKQNYGWLLVIALMMTGTLSVRLPIRVFHPKTRENVLPFLQAYFRRCPIEESRQKLENRFIESVLFYQDSRPVINLARNEPISDCTAYEGELRQNEIPLELTMEENGQFRTDPKRVQVYAQRLRAMNSYRSKDNTSKVGLGRTTR